MCGHTPSNGPYYVFRRLKILRFFTKLSFVLLNRIYPKFLASLVQPSWLAKQAIERLVNFSSIVKQRESSDFSPDLGNCKVKCVCVHYPDKTILVVMYKMRKTRSGLQTQNCYVEF